MQGVQRGVCAICPQTVAAAAAAHKCETYEYVCVCLSVFVFHVHCSVFSVFCFLFSFLTFLHALAPVCVCVCIYKYSNFNYCVISDTKWASTWDVGGQADRGVAHIKPPWKGVQCKQRDNEFKSNIVCRKITTQSTLCGHRHTHIHTDNYTHCLHIQSHAVRQSYKRKNSAASARQMKVNGSSWGSCSQRSNWWWFEYPVKCKMN